MNLFDDFNRDYYGARLYAEPSFSYLNRSARSEADRVRRTLEAWFSRYPEGEKADLRGRFRDSDDPQHYASFFELFLHELLLQLNCEVEVHPEISGTSRTPDFLVTSRNGNSFYLEATLATGVSEEESAARARMNQVYDALNRLTSPNFFIGMEFKGVPETPPSARSMRGFLARRLSSLDPDEVTERYETEGSEALPRWNYEHEGWEIEFFPIPKIPEARGKPGVRPIGIRFPEIRWLNQGADLKDVILEKAHAYGDLNLPYVIAVNALSEYGVDRVDVTEALFGQEQVVVDIQARASASGVVRERDAVWIGQSGPRYTRVSAVLVASPVQPWNVPRAPIRLYHNPWATKAYEFVLTSLPQAVPGDTFGWPEGGRIYWVVGESVGSILGIPLSWPG